ASEDDVDDDSRVDGCALETGIEEDNIQEDVVVKTDPIPTKPASPTVIISAEKYAASIIAVGYGFHVTGDALETRKEDDNEEDQDERPMLPPPLIQVAQYEAVVDANMSNVSDLTAPTSTMMGERPLSGSTGACASGPSSQAQIPAPSTSTGIPDRQARNAHNPSNIICPTSAKLITDMMTLFNSQMSAMVEEIRSLKEQLSK
ncbi:hypothetical protein PENTCL1PPCAC_20692, partial [Pristionchus entomophagus]